MEQKLKTDFDKFISTSNFSNQEIKLKKEALDNFLKNGFPSRKLENWKFSDINQIIQKNIGELAFYNDYNIENEINDDIFIKEIEHNKIVIVNGKVEQLSFEYEESDKINLTTLDNFNQNSNDDNSLLSLNNSFSNKDSFFPFALIIAVFIYGGRVNFFLDSKFFKAHASYPFLKRYCKSLLLGKLVCINTLPLLFTLPALPDT